MAMREAAAQEPGVPDVPPGAAAPASARRRSFVIMALVALVAVPWAGYCEAILYTARSASADNGLVRNLETARLGAHLVDEECRSVVSRLRVLAGTLARPDPAPGIERAREVMAVRDVVHPEGGERNVVSAAVYGRDGTLIAGYALPQRRGGVQREPWFRQMRDPKRRLYVGDPRQVPGIQGPAATIVIPVTRGGRPWAYAVAYWQLQGLAPWLASAATADGVRIYILTASRNTVASAGGPGPPPPAQLAVAARALAKTSHQDSEFTGGLISGAAVAAMPRWVALVTQPESSARAATHFLVLRMLLLCLAISALTGIIAWTVLRQYHRQYELALEHDEMARRLQAQNAMLREQQESTATFLANASHDMWTPLASMRFAVSSLLDTDVPWTLQQVRESLLMANTELDHMTRLVRNLLDMSRLEAHADTTPLQPCDLEGVVRAALERSRALLEGRHIDLDFPSRPLLIQCRQEQIETVLVNLIENAVKYSPDGSPLDLQGDLHDRNVVFVLRDRGTGIQPEDLRRIFDKFYRAQPDHRMGGSGLGLAICKAVIEQHGGRIGAANRPGGGAEFWFSLPALALARDKQR